MSPRQETTFVIVTTIALAIVLFFAVLGAQGSPPIIATNPATSVTDQLATLNGALSDLGNGSADPNPFVLRQHAEMDCAPLVCTITFNAATIPGDTLVLSGQSDTAGQEYCAAPTDNGGNTWSTFFGRSDTQSRGGMSWVTNALAVTNITVTRCSGDHLRTLNVFDYPPSTVFTPAMTELNSAQDGYGISLASVHTAAVTVVETFTPNLGTNCVVNTAKQGTYLGKAQSPGTAVNICSHSMTNITGTNDSVSNNDGGGFGGGVAIDLQRPFSANVGFLWGTSPALIGATNVTVGLTFVTGSFSQAISGLNHDTAYYFQAWGNSSAGFGNGTILTFNTQSDVFARASSAFWLLMYLVFLTVIVVAAYRLRRAL